MSGNPIAFQADAFDNDAFQTGSGAPAIVVVDDGRTMYGGRGGHGESDIEGMKARRRNRLREIEIREREQQELQAKLDRARDSKEPKIKAKAETFAKQMVSNTRRIELASAELKRLDDLMLMADAQIMRRKLLLAIMAAS